MDFNNYINDFVLAKNKMIERKQAEEIDKHAPVYNPFMEEESET